jgi:hypothetical protein
VITKPIDTRSFTHEIGSFLRSPKPNETPDGTQPAR